jgi:3-oxoacyl-[acyl-carrier protein] reductase
VRLNVVAPGTTNAGTQGLSRVVGSRGITVNNVQPGPIDTDLNPATGDWAVPQKAVTALNLCGHVDEIASMVAFVAALTLRTLPGQVSP